jgi:hypothetical protein
MLDMRAEQLAGGLFIAANDIPLQHEPHTRYLPLILHRHRGCAGFIADEQIADVWAGMIPPL